MIDKSDPWKGFTWPLCKKCGQRLCPSGQNSWECIEIKCMRNPVVTSPPDPYTELTMGRSRRDHWDAVGEGYAYEEGQRRRRWVNKMEREEMDFRRRVMGTFRPSPGTPSNIEEVRRNPEATVAYFSVRIMCHDCHALTHRYSTIAWEFAQRLKQDNQHMVIPLETLCRGSCPRWEGLYDIWVSKTCECGFITVRVLGNIEIYPYRCPLCPEG